MRQRLADWARANLRTAIWESALLASWAALYLLILLTSMAGLIMVAGGWDPVIVTSGSMSPSLRAGDVIFLDEHPDDLVGQQSVITFERPGDPDGELVTHRVFQVDRASDSYVTKGDANPTADSDEVHRDDVVGVGRMVVPLLGLPVVWMQTGNIGALLALAIVVLMAVGSAVTSALRTRGAREFDDSRFTGDERGISGVRLIVALMIGMQFFVHDDSFALEAIGITRGMTLVLSLVALVGISVLAAYRTRQDDARTAKRLAVVELAGDTLVVVVFVAATGVSGIGWVLMALPIIEAAIRFRLNGAFIHWMLMSGLTIMAFFWTRSSVGTPQSVVLEELGEVIDQLGVLLMVVIPGSYLAEQLLGDVVTQRTATRKARDRSRIIESVTEAGHDLTRLGGHLFESLADATLDVGFHVAEAWIQTGPDEWDLLARAGDATWLLPPPGESGSGMRTEDLTMPEIVIDEDDPDPDEFTALRRSGASVLFRTTLSSSDGLAVGFRVAATELSEDPASQVMALRLLCGQAAVALQNEHLLSELRVTHAELEHLAMRDALTGLANRAQFVKWLGQAIAGTQAGPPPHTVIFLDLNGFKAVNDRLGHNAGDQLLREVGQRIVDAVGTRGRVARLGGDEFTVLIDDPAGRRAGNDIADAIHLALADPFEIGEAQAEVGAAIGIASVEPGKDESEILREADTAMYSAKGLDVPWRTATYSAAIDKDARQRLQLAAEFRTALLRGELNLDYQPIVDAKTEVIVGVEALIRWNHREIGPVGANLIVELAETTGCVDDLNSWILATALSEVTECTRSSSSPVFVAVNVSPRELEMPTLVRNMKEAIAGAGIPASRVVVELSERVVARGPGLSTNVAELTDLGLSIALDDFGEGQTSLAHLRSLPISYLKLDRVFVRHADNSPTDRKILTSVVSLAHELGFTVIAEGIETASHHAIVSEAGADLLQGHGLHRPMPVDRLRALFEGITQPKPLPPAVAGTRVF